MDVFQYYLARDITEQRDQRKASVFPSYEVAIEAVIQKLKSAKRNPALLPEIMSDVQMLANMRDDVLNEVAVKYDKTVTGC